MASPVPQKDDVERWTVEQVAVWLRQMELTDCCEFFLRKGIDGRSLMELTEQELMIFGRELSIRNRNKIMRLIKQIENQYLVSTGKLQPSQIIPLPRQPVGTPSNPQYNHDQEKETSSDEVNDDDDGFSSTEFDDDVEQEPLNDEMHSGYAPSSTDSGSGEDLYLTPLPAPAQGNRIYPPGPAPRPPPTKPTGMGGNPPEKRPPMPLPFSGGVIQVPSNQSSSHQRLGGKIGGPKLPPGHGDLSKRNQPLLPSPSSSEPPRRPPPIPGPAMQSSGPTNTLRQISSKPSDFPPNVKPQIQLGDWSSKKSSEPSPTQNSSGHRHVSSSNSNEGAGTTKKGISIGAELQQKLNSSMHITNFKTETTDTGNEYEVVENPSATFTGRESHSGSPPSFVPPNQAPPPLPQRNQDGRDGNRSSANLQQPSSVGAGSNVTPNRQHSSGLGLKSRSTHPTAPSNINKNRPPAVLPGPPSNIQNKNLSHSSVSNSQDWSQQQVHHPGGQIRLPKQGSGRSSPHLAGVFPPLERAPMIPIEGAGLQNASGGLSIGPERISIGDGESIELTPLYRTLLDRPYFHVISRSKSKKLLENALDGVYLIRPSTRSSDPLTLSLLHNGRIYNINIRRRQDGLYALGKEKVNEVTFSSVDEIVSTYTNEPIKLQSENLQSGKRVTLTNSPAKVDHIYVKMPDNFKKKY